jgi:CelD/BcsL family acetyltransferase involved in cellulose biosynthesis
VGANADTTVCTGTAATARLRNPAFRSDWLRLHAVCPWATRYQHPDFSDAWWDVYHVRYDPVVLEWRGTDGALRGLLLLAREQHGTTIVPLGSHHAEYHTWLATETDGDLFMPLALRALKAATPTRQLRFHFLAPGSPLAWVSQHRGVRAPVVFVSPHSRGLRDVGDGSLDRAALRKKSTRSKLARLRRGGDAVYLSVRSEKEFAKWLPQISAQCDARHGTDEVPGPFAADALKGEFYLRLMRTPGLAHCGLLVRGDELLASHTGLVDQGVLGLGLITFDLAEGDNSPGKILIHQLCEDLAASDMHTFDLTPGGAYKERFATRSDTVYSLDIRFMLADALSTTLIRTARRTARRLLNTLRRR